MPIIRYAKLFILLPLVLWSGQAWAAVTITFYSHEFGASFPHAFVIVRGTVDMTGEEVDTNYGFTATSISPAILLGSVKGEVSSKLTDGYIKNSDARFSLVLTDEQYGKVLAKAREWREYPQKSYNLGKRNCVHFIGELAQAIGLKTNAKSKYFKKPRSYLIEVIGLNRDAINVIDDQP